MTALLWPVHDWQCATVAWCFDYDAAVALVNATTTRELYIGEPRYDTPETRARLMAPVLELEAKRIGKDRWQVAA